MLPRPFDELASALTTIMSRLNRCSVAPDGRRVCYVHDRNGVARATTGGGGGGYNGMSSTFSDLLNDAYVVVITFLVTCAVVSAVNLYKDYRRRDRKRRKALDAQKLMYNMRSHRGKPPLMSSRSLSGSISSSIRGLASQVVEFGRTTRTNSDLSDAGKSTEPVSLVSSLAKLEGGMHSYGNLTSAILAQMWDNLNVSISNMIKEMVEPILKDLNLGVPIHFIKLDLGNVPIKAQNMFVHRVDSDGQGRASGVQIDVDVAWGGNCDIMLQANFSKSAKITFGIKSIKLSGRMNILLSPLTSEMPVISAMQYGFTNPPDLHLEYTGVVKTVASLGFVESAIASTCNTLLADMLVLPNRMVMPMDLGSYDFFDTYQPPMGMIRLTAVEGRGFTKTRTAMITDIPDIYCIISLGASRESQKPFRTSTKWNDCNPSWANESGDFILYDLDQKIYLEVYDQDMGPDPDDRLGDAQISVRDLFSKNGQCEVELKNKGHYTDLFVTLSSEFFYLSEELQSLSFTNKKDKGKDKLCGLATIIVTKGSNIPLRREDAGTYVKVVYGEGSKHEKTFYTGAVVDYPGYDALNPMYDCAFQVPITPDMLRSQGDKKGKNLAKSILLRRSSIDSNDGDDTNATGNDIVFTLIDGGANGTKGIGEMGKITVTHESLLHANKHTLTETRHIGHAGAKLEFRIVLSGIQSEAEKSEAARKSADSPLQNKPPSIYGGIIDGDAAVRITAVKGRGFQLKKRQFYKKVDVPDVYCCISVISGDNPDRHASVWTTSTVKDDSMPRWNEHKEFSNVNLAHDFLRVDAYEEDNYGEDDYIGRAEFSVESLLRKLNVETELLMESEGTGAYVTFGAALIDNDNGAENNGAILGKDMSRRTLEILEEDNFLFDEDENSDDADAPFQDRQISRLSSHQYQTPLPDVHEHVDEHSFSSSGSSLCNGNSEKTSTDIPKSRVFRKVRAAASLAVAMRSKRKVGGDAALTTNVVNKRKSEEK